MNKTKALTVYETIEKEGISDDQLKQLFHAAARNDVMTCAALINAGADPSATMADGRTPAHLSAAAAPGGDPGERLKAAVTATYLEAHNRDPDIADNAGMTPLMIAARRGNDALVAGLLRMGASAEWANPHDPMRIGKHSEALHYAMLSDSLGGGLCNICEMLLTRGANADASNEKGRSPLHVMAWYVGHVLPELNADPKQAEEWRNAASLLVGYGADGMAEDAGGHTPLEILMQGDDRGNSAARTIRDALRKVLLEAAGVRSGSSAEVAGRPRAGPSEELAP